MKKVFVVTVNYNTAEDTKQFLKSLEKVNTSGLSLHTIVIDNGSREIFKPEDNKHVTVIRSEINTGFTGGYNIGIVEALKQGAEYVLIVNNDTTMESNLIINMLSVLTNDKNIGVAVPKIYFAKGHEFHKDRYKENERGKVFWYAGGYIDWDNVKSVHRGVDEVDHGQYDAIEPTDFATGCCMMFKKEVLEKVGFFDDQYFLYYEDADFNQRIKRAGYKIYYVPTAVLFHNNASSSGGAGNSLHDYFITRNQILFGMKYAPLRAKLALFRQSLRLITNGRPYQKLAIQDFYFRKLGKGTFFDK